MRIRKNAKLSPLFFSNDGGSVPLQNFQTPVCQLNQSPWDVIPFDSYSPQFEGEDSFTGNGSPGDSIGAVESVASMMDAEDKSQPKLADMVVDDDNGIGGNGKQAKLLDDNGIAFDKAEQKTTSCSRCKNHEAKQGRSFCEHNLSLIRSYNSGSNSYTTPSSKKAAAAAAAAAADAAGARRARARTAKKAPSSNPYEFYYYSGFGPLWGKRRGDRNGGGNKNHEAKGGENSTITEATTENATPTTAPTIQSSPCDSSSQIDNEGFDYDDDEEEEEEDDEEEEEGNGEGGKKRMRKPVKARSLKSLM